MLLAFFTHYQNKKFGIRKLVSFLLLMLACTLYIINTTSIMTMLADIFPTKEAFIEAAQRLGYDSGKCMLVAAFGKVSFVGYTGDDRLTDFDGIGTVSEDEQVGDYTRITDFSCLACGQCVTIKDVGEYASVLTSGDLVCRPVELEQSK